MDDGPLDEIKKIGSEPVIRMVESLIDEGKLTRLHTNEILLRNLFLPAENWITWCERWCNDERKELVILNSLRIILTDLINNKPSKTRDRAVKLAKFFAKKKDVDYEKETKGIDYGIGNENKEQAIRALHVLKVIQSKRKKGPIDATTLTNNLKKAPNLRKVIGEKREKELIEKASSYNPHNLAHVFSQKLGGVEELLPSQLYWENVFRVLDEKEVPIPDSKLNELMNDNNILAEFEVFSRLARHFFKITIEPDIEGLGDLDARIEFEGEKALIEVATVHQRRDILLAQGGTYIPGKDVKNTLDRKFKGQLNAGKSNRGMPILIILHLDNFGPGLGALEIQNGIYGVLSVSPVEDKYTREKNGFYDEPRSNIVTAIGAYERDFGEGNPLVGKFYKPPVASVNEMSEKFYLRISEALFGKSEPND